MAGKKRGRSPVKPWYRDWKVLFVVVGGLSVFLLMSWGALRTPPPNPLAPVSPSGEAPSGKAPLGSQGGR